jgi:hypothetical protein
VGGVRANVVPEPSTMTLAHWETVTVPTPGLWNHVPLSVPPTYSTGADTRVASSARTASASSALGCHGGRTRPGPLEAGRRPRYQRLLPGTPVAPAELVLTSSRAAVLPSRSRSRAHHRDQLVTDSAVCTNFTVHRNRRPADSTPPSTATSLCPMEVDSHGRGGGRH